LRLKGNHALDVGRADVTCTGDFARGASERFAIGARLFEAGVETNTGVLHEPGHPAPWIVAMECVPTAAAVRDYGLRWGSEPMFSDVKSRGFGLEDTRRRCPERVARLVLILTLAMYWCVETGYRDAHESPTPLEKNCRANRSRALELSQARPLLPVVVSARPEKAPAPGRARASVAMLRSPRCPGLQPVWLN
jgi:hypothetical protein